MILASTTIIAPPTTTISPPATQNIVWNYAEMWNTFNTSFLKWRWWWVVSCEWSGERGGGESFHNFHNFFSAAFPASAKLSLHCIQWQSTFAKHFFPTSTKCSFGTWCPPVLRVVNILLCCFLHYCSCPLLQHGNFSGTFCTDKSVLNLVWAFYFSQEWLGDKKKRQQRHCYNQSWNKVTVFKCFIFLAPSDWRWLVYQ